MTYPADAIERLGLYNASVLDVPYTLVGPDGFGHLTWHVQSMTDLATFGSYVHDLEATLVVSPDASVKNIFALSQSEYDALGAIDSGTLYIITGI